MNGKGSARRPASISKEQWNENYDRIFKKRLSSRKDWTELHYEISKILHNEWDSIGINDVEEAYDEYDAYVNYIVKMKDIISEVELYDFLVNTRVVKMGLICSPGYILPFDEHAISKKIMNIIKTVG